MVPTKTPQGDAVAQVPGYNDGVTPIMTFSAVSENATDTLGAALASCLRVGDIVHLTGELGAGKTALARSIIRSLHNQPELDVTSPTYNIVQTYPGRVPVLHADLYRLEAPEDVIELGLEEASDTHLMLVEWPCRVAAEVWETPPLKVAGSISGDKGRVWTVLGGAGWHARLRDLKVI